MPAPNGGEVKAEYRPPFTLQSSDRNSATWARLVDHFKKRLAELRVQNDGALDPIQTAKLRGQISILKEIIRLEDEMPPIDG